jgi:hypothetical protein
LFFFGHRGGDCGEEELVEDVVSAFGQVGRGVKVFLLVKVVEHIEDSEFVGIHY